MGKCMENIWKKARKSRALNMKDESERSGKTFSKVKKFRKNVKVGVRVSFRKNVKVGVRVWKVV
jgi:hypothetical protein